MKSARFALLAVGLAVGLHGPACTKASEALSPPPSYAPVADAAAAPEKVVPAGQAAAPARDNPSPPQSPPEPDAGEAELAADAASIAHDVAPGSPTPLPAPSASPQPAAQCGSDEDCVLVNDCCSCLARPATQGSPACDDKIACVIPKCVEHGFVGPPRCLAGRCVLALDCDAQAVTCKRAAPSCPPGQVPSVLPGESPCFGECVDARQCAFVPSCAGCPTQDACVVVEGRAHCVPPGS